MILGRPCSSREEESARRLIKDCTNADSGIPSFDLDLPIEVDDEYWQTEDPALAFKQPPGKPSKIVHLVYWIKLTQIAAFALRTLVCFLKS